jgi:LacI family transcriptional regulator
MMDAVQVGIHQYTLGNPRWRTALAFDGELTEEGMDDVFTWNPDGILVLTKPYLIPNILQKPDIPKVVVDLYHQRPEHLSRIISDEKALGEVVASYFLRNRFKHFAMVTRPTNPTYSPLRAEGFMSKLSEKGFKASMFELEQVFERPWYRNADLEKWLMALPKPVAIFSETDAGAVRVIKHCEFAGIRIPSEASIMGSNNANDVICTTTHPSITSISLPLKRMGFRAAEVLDEVMQSRAKGESLQPVQVVVEPGEVVERQSTSLRAIPDPSIAKAVNYLHDHALEGARITDAARIAGLSRRTLEMGMQKHLGITPGHYLSEVKIDHAKRVLIETELRMWEVAETCNMSPEYFNTLFKKMTGQTPNSYRKQKSSRALFTSN